MANLSNLLAGQSNIVTDQDLATVATTGSYSDLTNKPAIPSIAGLATTAELANYATLTGTQTLTNKTINFANNTLTGVQPTLVSGTNIKTVGGQSILGSGDLAITGGLTAANVGTAPNQLPLNQMLGSMAYQNAAGISVGAIRANGSAQISNPLADISVTVGEQGGGSYYNSVRIWSAYNATHPTHLFWQTSGTGATWTAGMGITLNFATGGGGVALAYNGTSWTSASDLRLKNVTGGFDNALDAVAQLEPIRFTWKYDEAAKPCVGLAAQSVASVLPEAISTLQHPVNKQDKTEYLGVKYTEVIPLLVAAIQELNAEIRALKGL